MIGDGTASIPSFEFETSRAFLPFHSGHLQPFHLKLASILPNGLAQLKSIGIIPSPEFDTSRALCIFMFETTRAFRLFNLTNRERSAIQIRKVASVPPFEIEQCEGSLLNN